jgi:hypothetical protein
MLKTFLISRPYAIFDATNADHRRAYVRYLKTNSWADCPYQFICEHPYIELPANINQKLVEYYLALDFKKVKLKFVQKLVD